MPYRPKIGVARTEQFVTRVAPHELEGMQRAISADGTSRSDYVRGLIRADLAKRGEKL